MGNAPVPEFLTGPPYFPRNLFANGALSAVSHVLHVPFRWQLHLRQALGPEPDDGAGAEAFTKFPDLEAEVQHAASGRRIGEIGEVGLQRLLGIDQRAR